MDDIEKQWEQFMSEDFNDQEMKSYDAQIYGADHLIDDHTYENKDNDNMIYPENDSNIPTCGPLKISTKTKIHIFEFYL